jgi:hypothetical protein
MEMTDQKKSVSFADANNIKLKDDNMPLEDPEKLDDISEKLISNQQDPLNRHGLLYHGYPRSVWVGLYVGSIVNFICNNIFTVLILGFITYPAVGVIPVVLDVFVLIPAFIIARRGLAATEIVSDPDPAGSWNIGWLILYSFLINQGILWTLDSYIKLAALLEPVCAHTDGVSEDAYHQSCSWAHHPGEFYFHALTGPAVLITSTFNFYKFSRGLVFPIEFHRWTGRIHNFFVLCAGIGSVFLAIVSATASWIKIGFYILVCFWIPTMLMGWYHITKIHKDVVLHKRWMTRNYALTCCAITLRLYNLLSLGNTPYFLMVYLSLIHPVIVEMYLQYTDSCDILWWKEKLNRFFRK